MPTVMEMVTAARAQIENLDGGFKGWVAKGRPVTAPTPAARSQEAS